jgi:hypothetical protein
MITLWENRFFATQLAIAILNCNNHLQLTIFLHLQWYQTSCKSCNNTIHHIWNQYTYSTHVIMLQKNHCYYCVTMLQLLWYYVVTTIWDKKIIWILIATHLQLLQNTRGTLEKTTTIYNYILFAKKHPLLKIA